MKRSSEQSPNGFGLLAQGVAGPWTVEVDEALGREDEWSLDIEGPNVYLTFQVLDLGVVGQAVRFLQFPPRGDPQAGRQAGSKPNESLTIGQFGQAPVSLVWDNEEFPRCFLIVGPGLSSTMRLSLQGDDLRMLGEAFRQVGEDLPDGADGQA
jgi:hypothetical protein